MPISTVWILKYVQKCYVKWFWTIYSLGAPEVNICVQVHKRINVRSPGYMSDLLVLNSDINERNNRNSSLNLLVCPRFQRETGGGGWEGGTYIWCKGNKIVECSSAKFFKEDWMCT